MYARFWHGVLFI